MIVVEADGSTDGRGVWGEKVNGTEEQRSRTEVTRSSGTGSTKR